MERSSASMRVMAIQNLLEWDEEISDNNARSPG